MDITYGPSNDKGLPRWERQLNLKHQEADRLHQVHTARKNRKFARLPADQQRVAIAQDVLLWLRTGKAFAKPGEYLSPNKYDDEDNVIAVIGGQSSTRVNGGACSVCALGALFACAVESNGGLQNFWNPVVSVTAPWGGGTQGAMHTYLAPYFDKLQLELIESAFERGSFVSIAAEDGRSYDERVKEALGRAELAIKFGLKASDDPGERMAAIMRNIIANGGTFCPEQDPT